MAVVFSKLKRKPKSRKRLPAGHYEEMLAGQMVAAGLSAPVRELRFHPVRRWRFDLALPALLLAIEVDGGSFVYRGGRHATDEDKRKFHEATRLGWRVLHFSPAMVKSGEAVEVIRNVIDALSLTIST